MTLICSSPRKTLVDPRGRMSLRQVGGVWLSAFSLLTNLHVLTVHIPENAPGPGFLGAPPSSLLELAPEGSFCFDSSGGYYCVRQTGPAGFPLLDNECLLQPLFPWSGFLLLWFINKFHGESWTHMGRLRYFERNMTQTPGINMTSFMLSKVLWQLPDLFHWEMRILFLNLLIIAYY